MKKKFEAPELNIQSFDIQDAITNDLSINIGEGLYGDEGVETW